MIQPLAIRIGANPYIFETGNLVLTWHGLFTFIAVAVAVVLIARWGKKAGIDADKMASPVEEQGSAYSTNETA